MYRLYSQLICYKLTQDDINMSENGSTGPVRAIEEFGGTLVNMPNSWDSGVSPVEQPIVKQ